MKVMSISSLNFRRDVRSLEEFAKDIKDYTSIERYLIHEVFAAEAQAQGHAIRIEDYGTDNSGDVVDKSSSKPDYRIVMEKGRYLVEVKHSPVSYKCTFKVHDLQEYIAQNALILLFYGTGYIKDSGTINRKTTRWGWITPSAMKRMLAEKTPYKDKGFGYKPCIRIIAKEFDRYFPSYELKA